MKPSPEKKTSGTVAVEKHRPLLNKLTEAGRRRLRQRAATLLYCHEVNAEEMVGSVEAFAAHIQGRKKLTLRTHQLSLPPRSNRSDPKK